MRYLPLNSEDRADMLARVGVAGIDALFADIPEAKRLDHDLDLPHAQDRNGGGAVALSARGKKCGGGFSAIFCWRGGL